MTREIACALSERSRRSRTRWAATHWRQELNRFPRGAGRSSCPAERFLSKRRWIMLRFSFALAGVLIVAGAVSGFAQEHKMEVSAFGGWSFADGVSGSTFVNLAGEAYNRIDPKDSSLFGFS